jgi:hypothetical protein
MILIHEALCLNHFASLKHAGVVNYTKFFKSFTFTSEMETIVWFFIFLDCKGTGVFYFLELGFRWVIFLTHFRNFGFLFFFVFFALLLMLMLMLMLILTLMLTFMFI